MSTSEVRERDLTRLRDVVASLRAPPAAASPDPDAPWGTPRELLCRDPHGPGVRWASLALLRELLHCDRVSLEGCDTAQQRRFFDQGVAAAGPESLQIFRQEPGPDDPSRRDPWHDEAERYYWDTYATSSMGYAYRSGDWDTVLSVPMVFRNPLAEERSGEEPPHGRCLLATAPLCAARQVQLFAFRWDRTPFAERELGYLELLKPHLVDAWRRSLVHEPPLTEAQRRVLTLVRNGLTNRQVGRDLGISEATVRTHLQNAYAALGVNNRVAAVAAAFGTEPGAPVPDAAYGASIESLSLDPPPGFAGVRSRS